MRQFIHRFDAYTDLERAGAFELVIARIDGEPCGQVWGWPLTAKTGWWSGLQLHECDETEFTAENGSRILAFMKLWSASHSPAGASRAPCTMNCSLTAPSNARHCSSAPTISAPTTTIGGGAGTGSVCCAHPGRTPHSSTS